MQDQNPVRRVVAPVSGEDGEQLAHQTAVSMAHALSAPLVGLHVTEDPEQAAPDLWDYLTLTARRWDVALDSRVLLGLDPAETLAGELEAGDLVVIGSRRLGTAYHLGSVAEALIHVGPAMVQVVPLQG